MQREGFEVKAGCNQVVAARAAETFLSIAAAAVATLLAPEEQVLDSDSLMSF